MSFSRWRDRRVLLFACLLLSTPILQAVTVHGTVTDTLGRPIPNATVGLVQNGKVIANAHSNYDGTYQISSSATGQFYILVGGTSFRQLTTGSFYGGEFDAVEQNVVLEPEWVRQSIVVTATGTPQPQAQVSASVSVLTKADFQNRTDMVDPLRQVPGFNIVQTGQRGGVTSIFIRGGNSDSNKILFDGVPMEDIGGRFDLSTVSSTGISSVEAYRGPNSVLWGSDAAAGVVAFSTPRGSTPFPSLLYEGDVGSFNTYRNEVQLGGTLRKFDYYGGFVDFQTKNSIPMDEYHNITSVANLGYAPSGSTSIRVTARNADIATGLPGAYAFNRIANDGKQSDQNIFLSGTIDHSFSDFWHALVRYGMARKREESTQWYPAGNLIDGNYFGNFVTIKGANGFSTAGQALMNFGGIYPYTIDLVSNRDNLYAQTDYSVTPHLAIVGGFRFENERGAENEWVYDFSETLERTNYDYMLEINGDFRQRLFYSLGGGIQKNQLYGTEGTPRIGVAYYAVRPGKGIFHGTKVYFNFAKGVKEPTIDDQFGSLYAFLLANGGQSTVNQYGIRPIGAELSRSYDGGVEQSLFNEKVVLRATYFHNEFGNQIEYVGASLVPTLLPNLTPEQQQSLQQFLEQEGAFSLTLNSLAFRAQGMESQVEYGIGRNIFIRGGYTYLDAVVQRSFSSDAVGPSFNPAFPTIPIGNDSPLVGARPFRRPPHTGFAGITYTSKHMTLVATGAFSSRGDDSTYLGGSDLNFGDTLLLPNRNLDHGFAKLDIGGTFPITSWLSYYAQVDNYLSQQHIAPIGYTSLPASIRTGLRFTLGRNIK
ncbi:MAG TPA: TonB-dependent receptor plug domain-containing protein [Silvibacterium sp.]|nr:TonB-dependent receptor plug domain-containing protein [Silvibacterium sp.]